MPSARPNLIDIGFLLQFLTLLQCSSLAALWMCTSPMLHSIGRTVTMCESVMELAQYTSSQIALSNTVAVLNIEPKCKCNIYCFFSLSLRFWRVQ
jgi:hypothetical protein